MNRMSLTSSWRKCYSVSICVLGLLLALTSSGLAQKIILISDSLAANAEKVQVKFGSGGSEESRTALWGVCGCFQQGGVVNLDR